MNLIARQFQQMEMRIAGATIAASNRLATEAVEDQLHRPATQQEIADFTGKLMPSGAGQKSGFTCSYKL